MHSDIYIDSCMVDGDERYMKIGCTEEKQL